MSTTDNSGWKRDERGKMVALPIDPKFLDKDGNIIRVADQKAAADRARAIASKAAEVAQMDAEAKLSPLQKQIRAMEVQEKDARRKGETERRKMYTEKLEDLRDQQRQVEHRAKVDGDPWVAALLQSRDAMARSGRTIHPGADPNDLDTYVALIDARHEFPDVESFKVAIKQLDEKIVGDDLNHHRKKESDATVAHAKAELDLANAKVATHTAEMRATLGRDSV